MTITKVVRTYSRSINLKKPDGGEMWIRHEATVEALLDENDSQSQFPTQTVDEKVLTLEAMVRKEVTSALKGEREGLEKLWAKEVGGDEPFPGKMPNVASMPKL